MTRQEAVEIVSQIRYPGVQLSVSKGDDHLLSELLSVVIALTPVMDRDLWEKEGRLEVSLTVSGKPDRIASVLRVAYLDIDPYLFVHTIYDAVRDLILHEFNEFFVFNDVRIFDPHCTEQERQVLQNKAFGASPDSFVRSGVTFEKESAPGRAIVPAGI